MTPFEQYFRPIFGTACGIAFMLSMIAAGRRDVMRLLLPGLASGICWGGLFLGLDQGYAAWQSISEPPPAAFEDQLTGLAMLLGWLPAAVFVAFSYLLGRIVLRLTGRQENWRRARAASSFGSANPYFLPSMELED